MPLLPWSPHGMRKHCFAHCGRTAAEGCECLLQMEYDRTHLPDESSRPPKQDDTKLEAK